MIIKCLQNDLLIKMSLGEKEKKIFPYFLMLILRTFSNKLIKGY